MMKILVTCQSSALGGVEKRLETEVEVIQSKGWESVVSVSDFVKKELWQKRVSALGARFLEWNPYKFIERRQVFVFWKFLAYLSRRKMARQGFDLAHVALPWTTVGMTRLHELTKSRVPAVLALHCTYPLEKFPEEVLREIKSSLQGVVAAYAVSNSVKESFLSNFGEYCSHFRIQVIHNGVDCGAFARDEVARKILRERINVAESDFLVLFCGRLSDMKRPEFALKIMGDKAFARSKVKMLVVGEGERREALVSYVERNGLTDRVSFMGFVENMRAVYSAADAYISTSENREGFPLAASEALAAGLPLLLPDHPVFLECFGACESAEFFDGSEPSGWIEGILRVSSQSHAERENHARNAEQYARVNLDISIMKNRISEFYDRVVSERLPAGNRNPIVVDAIERSGIGK